MRSVLFALATLAVTPAFSSSDAAQERPAARVIDGRPSCPACKVVLREIAILGDSLEETSPRPDAAGRDCMVGRLSSGEYVVSGIVGGGQINVYSSTGKLLRTIGRKGSGPGEFGTTLRVAVGPGDTLVVMDEGNLRVQVLTPQGSYVRSFPAPGRIRSFALLPKGELLFYRSPTRADDVLFHILDRQGRERAQFGKTSNVALDVEMWSVSPARPTGFWTASFWKYELYRWNKAHALAETLTRRVEWFPPNAKYPEGAFRTTLPPPALMHVWQDSSQRLWTFSLLPDPKWVPGSPARPSPQWLRSTYDTVIELIDLDKARVVATGTYDTKVGVMCGSSLMYTVVETPDCDTRVRILEPRVATQ